MIEALIFDMDGTLVDSEKLHYEAWKQILENHGVPSFPFDDFVKYVGTSNEKLASDYKSSHQLEVATETMIREKQAVYLEMVPDIETMPGVFEIIERFKGKFRLGIASSSHLIELERIIEVLGLQHVFEHIVGGDMITNKKPDPEIYSYTSSLFELVPGKCLAFEDSVPGIAAAKAAGLYGVAIPNILSTDNDFSKADRIVSRIDHVDDQLIRELAG